MQNPGRAAAKSANEITKTARVAFLALPNDLRLSLCAAIFVFDNAPDITNARLEIEEAVAFATAADHVPTLVDYLEGWWVAEVIRKRNARGGLSSFRECKRIEYAQTTRQA